jgi:rare lipoprotein A
VRFLLAPLLVSVIALVLVACAHEQAKPLNVNVAPTRADVAHTDMDFVGRTTAPNIAPDQVGLATWYGQSFAGKKTSNGERFDPEAMTAAHRTFPFGTWVEVRRPETGSVVRVRINDRGPFGDSRKVIDLSHRAAELLGISSMGSARVELRVVSGP